MIARSMDNMYQELMILWNQEKGNNILRSLFREIVNLSPLVAEVVCFLLSLDYKVFILIEFLGTEAYLIKCPN